MRRWGVTFGIFVLLLALSTPALAQRISLSKSVEERTVLVPSLSLNIGSMTRYQAGRDGSQSRPHFSVFAGGALYPRVSNVSPFIAGGLEFEPIELADERSGLYILPVVQAGVSVLGCYDNLTAVTATFSCLKVYGIAGVRPGVPGNLPYGRLGLGLNSFWITLAGLHGNVFLPSTLEALVEMDPHGSRVLLFRMGLGF
ncbi:MAG: hypothetical protein VX475_02060 [Myxococcota bacterium]|nr:hypothetical protein [Myxococcota bacterium]